MNNDDSQITNELGEQRSSNDDAASAAHHRDSRIAQRSQNLW